LLAWWFYRRHSGLRTIRGGIRFGLNLRRLLPPKLRLLGYQRIVKSWGLSINLAVFAVPNILKSLFADLLFLALMLSAKTDAHFTSSILGL
jgi:hypothetical protein